MRDVSLGVELDAGVGDIDAVGADRDVVQERRLEAAQVDAAEPHRCAG